MLDNERKKTKQMSQYQASAILEKTDLENLFLECVDEVRKEVAKRQAKFFL